MKKYFLALLFTTITATASAGEIIYDYDLRLDGFYGYSEYSSRYRKENHHHHTPVAGEWVSSFGYRFDNDSELSLGLDAQISGGKEIKDYNHGYWGENIYVTYVSDYGELSAGQIYNAAYQMAVGAPSVGVFRVNNSPVTDFLANPNWHRKKHKTWYRTLNSTYLNTDADALKVSYTTPEFYHLKMAFSYTPDSYSEAGLINRHSRYENHSSYAAGLYGSWDIAGFEAESSLGYAYNRKNNQEVSAGLSLYRKGWTFGTSYRRSFTTSNDYKLNLPYGVNTPYYFDGYRRGDAFNIGLSYEIGPFKTGVSYFKATADKTSNKDEILTWSNRFALNKYAAIYVSMAYSEYTGDRDKSASSRGYATILGAELNF